MDLATQVRVTDVKPPNWATLVSAFGVEWGGVVVTYGPLIHSARPIPSDLLNHELVHAKQQGFSIQGAEKWWREYLANSKFRLSQEVEAYQKQVRFVKRFVSDRNDKARRVHRLAVDLSGPTYGNVVSYSEAYQLING